MFVFFLHSFYLSQQLFCPRSYNPADFYIQKLAIIPTKREECLGAIQTICNNYKNSRFYNNLQADLEHVNSKKGEIFVDTSSDERY
jgi:hypothetical protein